MENLKIIDWLTHLFKVLGVQPRLVLNYVLKSFCAFKNFETLSHQILQSEFEVAVLLRQPPREANITTPRLKDHS